MDLPDPLPMPLPPGMVRSGIVYAPCRVRNLAAPDRFVEVPYLLVDTGSECTWLPRAALEAIGLCEAVKTRTFAMADGRVITRPVVYAEIVIGPETALLRDLGSRNGTILDGVAVREAFVSEGAAIQIGRSQLRFELHADDVTMALSERTSFGAKLSCPMMSGPPRAKLFPAPALFNVSRVQLTRVAPVHPRA